MGDAAHAAYLDIMSEQLFSARENRESRPELLRELMTPHAEGHMASPDRTLDMVSLLISQCFPHISPLLFYHYPPPLSYLLYLPIFFLSSLPDLFPGCF